MLEIHKYLPPELLKKNIEHMQMDEFIEHWAKARYLQEVEETIFINAIFKALGGEES